MPVHLDNSASFSARTCLLLCRYLFRSGNPEHPGDKFYNTSVQVLSSSQSSKSGLVDKDEHMTEFPLTEDSFYVINHFNHDSGIAEGTLPEWLGPVDVLRLYVQYPSTSWAILNEVGCSCIVSNTPTFVSSFQIFITFAFWQWIESFLQALMQQL